MHPKCMWACLEQISQYRSERRGRHPTRSRKSETKHRFSPDSFFVNLADAKYSIGLVHVCLFSIYRAEVEIAARVYRAIFNPFLRRLVSAIRCIPRGAAARQRSGPSPLTRRNSLQQHTPVRHPPLFTTSKCRRCFFPLRCLKNFIRSLFGPFSSFPFDKTLGFEWNSTTILNRAAMWVREFPGVCR